MTIQRKLATKICNSTHKREHKAVEIKKASYGIIVRGHHLAGAEGFEPSARGFGDHCSTI